MCLYTCLHYGLHFHRICRHNSRFIDFAAAGINTDRIQLGSGKIVEDIDYDFFDEALNDLDLELSDSDKKLLVDLIKNRHMPLRSGMAHHQTGTSRRFMTG
jgi:ABC-type enterochelin transport system ATPase subunit